MLDNDTTLIITSDHGHIDRGGHGGKFASANPFLEADIVFYAGTHDLLIDIPLIVYQRGSGIGKGIKMNFPPSESDQSDLPEPNLPIGGADADPDTAKRQVPESFRASSRLHEGQQNAPRVTGLLTQGLSQERVWNNLDVVGTVCGLLGIPLPRQSAGLLIEQVIDELVKDPLHREAVYRDLFLQKKGFVYEYFAALGLNQDQLTSTFDYSHWTQNVTDDCLTTRGGNNHATPEAREECYKANANYLLRAYYSNRDRVFSARITRNVFINLAVGALIFAATVFITQRFSFANPLALPKFIKYKLSSVAKRVYRAGSVTYQRIRPLSINCTWCYSIGQFSPFIFLFYPAIELGMLEEDVAVESIASEANWSPPADLNYEVGILFAGLLVVSLYYHFVVLLVIIYALQQVASLRALPSFC